MNIDPWNATITNARYVEIHGTLDDEPVIQERLIEADFDGMTVRVSDQAVGNKWYESIMRQVEAGELTIQPADGE
jgi:hypothetical protein